MNTALSWIKAYVPGLECSDREYFDRMTMSGTKVETFQRLDKNLEKIVIGQITKIERHPDADKLVICQVNVGTETIQIVTGAPNAREGMKVPVVLDGGKVAGYAFCIIQEPLEDDNVLLPVKTLYIDDICVDENCRHQNIGKSLYEYVKNYAGETGCYNITLNVWSCNPGAMEFYEKMGLVPQKVGMEEVL